jgi:RsiW-degrading membrane proteinase PrsW (M82 family)
MEASAKIDSALNHQQSQRRERALAAIARYRTPTGAAVIPVWFALFVALLIAFVPSSRPNPIPYVVAMLAFAVGWVAVSVIRSNRRLEAIVQLISQDASHAIANT